jgi:hypothetical protein
LIISRGRVSRWLPSRKHLGWVSCMVYNLTLYIERLEPRILEKLGFSANSVDVDPDVLVRVPRYDESVFRAVVLNDGVPVCDVLQVWLDVGQHPSRGREQAGLIWREILAPVLLPKEQR